MKSGNFSGRIGAVFVVGAGAHKRPIGNNARSVSAASCSWCGLAESIAIPSEKGTILPRVGNVPARLILRRSKAAAPDPKRAAVSSLDLGIARFSEG